MKKMFHNFEIIEQSEISEYKYPGVWAMFGIKKGDNSSKYICLNVGKNKCIGDELKIDFERLECFMPFRKKIYKNQFNEEKFTYKEYATRQDWLYKEISEKYESIIIILVTNETEKLYTIEKYFAYSTKAAYWVSNGRYSPNLVIDSLEISKIRNDINISEIDKSLIKKIDEFKKWYDNQ